MGGGHGVAAKEFFKHVDKFMEYRSQVYEISDQTIKSNQCDINLFKDFITDNQHKTITGPAVMDFQYYLKTDRNNCAGSLNRKLFTLRSYSQFMIF